MERNYTFFLYSSANISLISLAPFALLTLLGIIELLPFIFLTSSQQDLGLPETRPQGHLYHY